MREFNYENLQSALWDNEIANYLASIHEQKGKTEVLARQSADALEKLVEIAKIQSTASSNEIEGIRTAGTRLKQLMAQKTAPKNRDEKEILGYRDALNLIHENFDFIPLTPNYILQLHKIMFSHTDTSIGGKYKSVQNYVSGVDKAGRTYTIFTPLSPLETPTALHSLCDSFNRAAGDGRVDPLILIPIFIHDFLCIHPFLDGNGRISRLLTTLLLYRGGYTVGKYISLEAKIAGSKDYYYDALYSSQANWHEGKDDPSPFVKYFLGIVASAYRDFDERCEIVSSGADSYSQVKTAAFSFIGRFAKSDLLKVLPSVSAATVERQLKRLCEEGIIQKRDKGKNTYYVRLQ